MEFRGARGPRRLNKRVLAGKGTAKRSATLVHQEMGRNRDQGTLSRAGRSLATAELQRELAETRQSGITFLEDQVPQGSPKRLGSRMLHWWAVQPFVKKGVPVPACLREIRLKISAPTSAAGNEPSRMMSGFLRRKLLNWAAGDQKDQDQRQNPAPEREEKFGGHSPSS